MVKFLIFLSCTYLYRVNKSTIWKFGWSFLPLLCTDIILLFWCWCFCLFELADNELLIMFQRRRFGQETFRFRGMEALIWRKMLYSKWFYMSSFLEKVTISIGLPSCLLLFFDDTLHTSVTWCCYCHQQCSWAGLTDIIAWLLFCSSLCDLTLS
jgi:hypothetical protein